MSSKKTKSKEVSLESFCSSHKVSALNKYVLNRKHGSGKRTIKEWKDLLVKEKINY